jgi:cytochrome P450
MAATESFPVPGPRGWELIRRLRRSQRDPLAEWTDARERFGDVVRYRAGRLPVFLVSHPDDVQRVLQGNWKNYRKGLVNRPLVPLLGRGLLTNEDEDWLAQRRLVQPAFHREHLAALVGIMAEEAERLAATWRAAARAGEPIEVSRDMHRLTFAIAGRALLGTRLEMDDALGRAFAVAVEHVNFRSRHPFALPEWVPTRRNHRYRRAAAEVDGLVRRIIRQRREEAGEGRDVLSLLLAARDADTGQGMDEQQLRDEALTFLVAGHETSANLLAWAWHLLARQPAALEAVRAEAEAVAGGLRVGAEHLPGLAFTRRVLDESLRLYPP